MRATERMVIVIAGATLLPACSSTRPSTPEDVCRQAVDALRRCDLAEFLDVCATESDVRAFVDKHPELTQKEKDAATEFWSTYGSTRLLDARTANFRDVRDAVDWSHAVIESTTCDVDQTKPTPTSDGFRIAVLIDSKRYALKIDDMILLNDGWRSTESRPLRLDLDTATSR